MVRRTFAVIISVLSLFAAASVPAVTSQTVTLPVIMYHSVSYTGGGNYIIKPDELKADFEYLKSRGYSAVTVNELIDFVGADGTLPKKPVLITFDDGFYNNYKYVLPLLEEFGFKATVGIVGKFTEKERGEKKRSCSYSYLSESELKKMYGSGRIEFANHSYDMHKIKGRKGVGKLKTESEEEYERVLTEDVGKCHKIVKDACGADMNVFAYPYGNCSKSTDKILKSLGYKAVLTCAERVNKIKKSDGKKMLNLGRFNRSALQDRKDFFKKIGVGG